MLASYPGKPCSETVGRLGSVVSRCLPATAMPRTRPSRISGSAGGREVLPIGAWFATTAVTACAGPKATGVAGTPASVRNSSSAPRCGVVPVPECA